MTLKEQINWCKHQIKQGYEVVAVTSILTRLQLLEKTKDPPNPLFAPFLQVYKNFLEGRNIPLVMDARQGKALNEIISKLSKASSDQSRQGVLNSWQFILKNWQRTGDFIGRQIQLTDINRNLQTILDLIRNGATKKQNRTDEAKRLHDELTEGN